MENIKSYYSITKEAQTPLLSNYSNADTDKDFWAFYRDNFEIFDRYFSREFDTFVFAFADKEQTTAENTADFVQAVKDLLTVNHKKYEELYRVETVDDDSYSMLENYDLTETMERETTKGQQINTTSSTEGQQTDNTTLTYGDKTETSTSQISPEDDENWRKTHRFAGILWVIGGAIITASAVFNSFVVLISAVGLNALAPVVYSYLDYRRHQK